MKRKTVKTSRRGTTFEVESNSLSDTGRIRESNEDVGLDIVAPNAPARAKSLLVVADGMGGHAAGEVASRMAVDEVVNSLSTGSPGVRDMGTRLENAVREANTVVYNASLHPDHRGMGTTLTAAIVVNSKLYVANVGDSRCYLYRNGKSKQVTEDHSYVEEQVRLGLLTVEEARTHPARNIITRAIGLEATVKIDIFTRSLTDGDRILLCTDGLYPLVPDYEIMEIVVNNSPFGACEELIAKANANGGNDNITVAVAVVEKRRIIKLRRGRKARKGKSVASTTRNDDTKIVKHPNGDSGYTRRLLNVIKGLFTNVFTLL